MELHNKSNSTMIRRLRKKFVLTAMGALLIMLILLVGVINITYLAHVTSSADMMLQILLDNSGVFPVQEFIPEPDENREESDDSAAPGPEPAPSLVPDFERVYQVEAPFETRYFSALVHDDMADIVDAEHIAAITETQIRQLSVQVVTGGRDRGYLNTYKFGTVRHEDGTVLVVFIDCSSRFSSSIELIKISLIIGAFAVVLMFVIVYLLSGLAVAPVVESLAKQKRFISDAGHELKTPLTVISANVDVLEMDGDKNEWTQSIRNQVRRMTDLVNNMLTLSRMEEGADDVIMSDVDLSQCMEESVSTYCTVAMAKGRALVTDIDTGIHMTGDRKSLAQLSSILLDNAMKYGSAGSDIDVRLFRDDKAAVYEVRNECDELPEGDFDRLFDRFYRADSSRSREKGGYGIGLSVAKAICENHGGTITAQRESDGRICFAARFPVTHSL